MKNSVQKLSRGLLNMFSSSKIYDNSVNRKLDRNDNNFDNDFSDIFNFLFSFSSNSKITKYIYGTDNTHDRGEQYIGIKNLDKIDNTDNTKKKEFTNFISLIDNIKKFNKSDDTKTKLEKIKTLVKEYLGLNEEFKNNKINENIPQPQPQQEQQSVILDTSLLKTIIEKNKIKNYAYKNIVIDEKYDNISDYLDVVIKLIETMNADTVNYKDSNDTNDLIEVFEFVNTEITNNNFTEPEQKIICEKMKKLEELKNLYLSGKDLLSININCQTQQGGKKRRTKCSKAPTSKRTRAKKCAKKAGKRSKRTAKKMRS